MANQAIALQARAPQGNFLAPAIQQAGQMANRMAQQQALDRQTAVAQQQMDIAGRKEARDITADKQARAKARVENVGVGLLSILRTPTDETLAQTAQTFKSVGMDPAEYEGVLAQISQIPDENQRKRFTLEYIAQSPGAREALKYVLPDVKSEMVGDARVFTDNNPNSPSFNAELFRITASPEQVKLSPQVVDSTLYNVNPLTGAASEATIGDAMTGLVPQPRTTTRTDSGVVSPYAIQNAAAPRMDGGLPGPRGAGMGVAAPRAPAPVGAPARGATPVATALQTNPGAIKDGSFARSQPGYAGASGGFATFDTPQAGIGAQENLLRKDYVGKGFNTISKIISRYAPPGGENAPAAVANYKNYVAQRSGIDVNAPITAAQVPAVAAAMREFETGVRPGGTSVGGGAPSPAAAVATPKTMAEAQREKAYKLVMPIIGYNPKTGGTQVEDLIKQSTSGGGEMLGSEIKGFFGTATPGRVALNQLKTIANNMTFEKLRGKLGAQISDADVRLIASTMGDIAEGRTPANERSAAWNNVVLPILLRGANLPPKAAIDRLRKDPSLQGAFDIKYGPGKAKEVLGR